MSMYNMLFGCNPASTLLLSMLGITADDVGRFRDCYLQRDPKTQELRIVVYTRNGGGGDYPRYREVTDALSKHPEYLRDAEDTCDNTYLSYFFKVPESVKFVAEELMCADADKHSSGEARFQQLLMRLAKGDVNDGVVQRVLGEVGALFDKLNIT